MKSYRLLYAEDNPLDAELTLTHFAEYAPGIEIEVVSTGQSCIARLGEASFDLLLLDYRLPDMDGLEVLKWLAKTGIPVPAVLVTGSGDEELVSKALRLCAVNYVTKGSTIWIAFLNSCVQCWKNTGLSKAREHRLLTMSERYSMLSTWPWTSS